MGIFVNMPAKKTNYFDELKQLGNRIRKTKGLKNENYGGIATYDAGQNMFDILECGASSHIEVQCLDKVDELVGRGMLNYNDILYLYLHTAPCITTNKNCLDRVIKWAKINPNKKLVLGFQKPSSCGSYAVNMSDKERWFIYRMDLMCRTLPSNLTIVSLYNTEIFHSLKNNHASDRPVRPTVIKNKLKVASLK